MTKPSDWCQNWSAGHCPERVEGAVEGGGILRVLGLDVGARRIGMALSDPEGILASPAGFLDRTTEEEDLRRVLEAASQHGVGRIVVGIPVSLSGRRGPQARAVDRFRRSLAGAFDLPVVSWDERLSTQHAERRLKEAGVEPSLERGRTDAAAAAIILQGYLDSLRNRP